MSKHDAQSESEETLRYVNLNSLIDGLFAGLGMGEIDALASNYDQFETRMLEIVSLRPRSSSLMDLMEDSEFKPVIFPKALMPHLRRRDVFLATIGFKNSVWTVLHLSHCYLSEQW